MNQRIRSMSCTARSMTTPTFDMRGGNGPTRVMAIERMSWSLIARLIDCTAGLKRSTWPTISVTPARRAAATMARLSSTVEAIGFSTMMWMPRAAQSIAMSRCRWVGAAMVTASTPWSQQCVGIVESGATERCGQQSRAACGRDRQRRPVSPPAIPTRRGHGYCPSRLRRQRRRAMRRPRLVSQHHS